MMYVPLNLKTEYSLLSSLIKIEDMISFAKQHHIQALTITDDNMFGVMEFVNACKQANIKPIIGLTIQIEKQELVLYARNNTGYHHLMKLATIMSERNLLFSDLEEYIDGLLVIVPYESMNLYSDITKIAEYVFKGYRTKEERLSYTGNHCVYMNEIRYFKEEDDKYLTILYQIRDGKTIHDTNIKQSGKYWRLDGEINTEWKEDFNNNQKIIELCDVQMDENEILLPIYECPNQLNSYTYLKQLCIQGLKEKFGTTVSVKYQERLKYELDIINKMGFCNYFLVVWDFVTYAKKNGILVGPGRGSAAGSLVSYLLNITSIDPLEYDLLFERFLNPERISMPDIDIDFADQRRDEVIQYCIHKYGQKRVAGIITFATLKSKQVVRDVGRVLEIESETIDTLTKMLDAKLNLITNYNQNHELKEYLKNHQHLMKLYKIALKLEGLKRQTSIHAAGIVMCQKDLDEIIPLHQNSDHFYVTGYSMNYLEPLGLLKMDFLALRNLSLIDDVLAMLHKDHIMISFDTIPNDDKKALSIFETVNTEGIFQFESSGMKNFLRKFKPNNFEEVVAALALFRPGPMNNIDTYIKRKRGLESVTYLHPSLEPILKSTYGIMIYQEQIMQVASIMANYSLGEADILRKAISKKKEDVLVKEQEKFIRQSMEKGYSKEVAEKAYQDILKFASYGFNRAHSVAYAVIAYRMAYLKAHYPKYFMKSLLSMAIGSSSKTKEYIYEAKFNHIDILKPDINQSSGNYTIEEAGIRYPLRNIRNVGDTIVRAILEERKQGVFTDIYDFVSRLYGKGVNRKSLESLIDAGCFDQFGNTRHTLMENLDLILNYGEIIKDVGKDYVDKPELTIYHEYSKYERMKKELEVFGFYLSNHPITEYKLKYSNIVPLSEIEHYFDKKINTIIYVDRMKFIETKKKETMCFITGSDEITTVDVVLFPRIYQEYSNIEEGNILLVNAKVEKRFDKYQLVINRVTVLEQ